MKWPFKYHFYRFVVNRNQFLSAIAANADFREGTTDPSLCIGREFFQNHRFRTLQPTCEKRHGCMNPLSDLLSNAQLQVMSHGANVEKAWLAESRKDFIHKYAIACKEARESHFWLRLLAASEVIANERLDPLITEANELIAILTTIIKKSRD